MKFLIPTDFSKASGAALRYAAGMALKLDAELIVLHILPYVASVGAGNFKEEKVREIIQTDAEKDCLRLINDLKSGPFAKLKIVHKVIEDGYLEDVVETFAKQNAVELIVMGTKGAGGLEKVLLGSKAAAVINNSSIPVLAIPKQALFNGLKHVVYASDLNDLISEAGAIVPLARLFGATLHIVHVNTQGSKKNIDEARKGVELREALQYDRLTFRVINNEDVEEALEIFMKATNADMLALFTHELDFYEKLFGKSLTRKMAFHASVPLLIFKKDW